MTFHEFWPSFILSLVAVGFSIFAFNRARPIEKRQFDSGAMLECFKILSNPEVKEAKAALAGILKIKKAKGEPAIFNDTVEIKRQAYLFEIAYNHASVLYELELLNKEHFEKIYGGGLVIAWKIVKDDVAHRSEIAKKPIFKELQEVAQKFISKGINPEPY